MTQAGGMVTMDYASWERGQKRIAELEAALKDFAQLLWSTKTEDIDPKGMWVLVPHQEDADIVGAEIIRARRLVAHLLPKSTS